MYNVIQSVQRKLQHIFSLKFAFILASFKYSQCEYLSPGVWSGGEMDWVLINNDTIYIYCNTLLLKSLWWQPRWHVPDANRCGWIWVRVVDYHWFRYWHVTVLAPRHFETNVCLSQLRSRTLLLFGHVGKFRMFSFHKNPSNLSSVEAAIAEMGQLNSLCWEQDGAFPSEGNLNDIFFKIERKFLSNIILWGATDEMSL